MQNDILRKECAHRINNVSGLLGNLRKPPAPWADHVFANQEWKSEARTVKGYGPGARLRVTIRFDDNCRNGHNTFSITGDIRGPKNEDIAGGCLHDDIGRVFPELAHLVRWHLVSTDGPMHYIPNTVYHAKENGATHGWVYFTGPNDPLSIGESKERLLSYAKADEARKAEGQPGYRVQWDDKTIKTRNLDHARSSACWPEATDEELMSSELSAMLSARLPALLAQFRTDMDAAGFMWAP